MTEYKQYITREIQIIQNEFMYDIIKQINSGNDINNNIDILLECLDYIKFLQSKEFIQYFESNKNELIKIQMTEYNNYLSKKEQQNTEILYLLLK